MGNRSEHRNRLEAGFLAYREDGDVAALGRVFDRVAGELYGVARGLGGSGDAEDLVQATFLTAIERAGSWDDSRPLMPWLLGILVRHARSAKRDRSRSPEPDRLWSAPPAGPLDAADAAEVREALEQALAELSESDRDVLEPVLKRNAKPSDLAEAVGVAPGTMRMRLSRALERLRDRLPAGVALPALLPLPVPVELRVVRSHVLGLAARKTGNGALVSPGVFPTLLALAMSPKFLLAPILLVVLLVGLRLRGEPAASAPLDPASRPTVELASAVKSTASIVPAAAPPALPETNRVTVERPPGPPALAAPAEERGRVRGRLVREGGAPVANAPIELVEIGGRGFTSGLLAVERALEPELTRVLQRARTDSEGVFEVASGLAGRTQLLQVHPGTAEGSRLFLDAAAEPGAVRDLGELVVPADAVVSGRVVDPGGVPLAGVRVRSLMVHEDFGLELGHVADRARVLAHSDGSLTSLLEPTAFVEEFLFRASAREAVTDAGGRFQVRVDPFEPFSLSLLEPQRGHRQLNSEGVGPAGQDLGELVLESGAASRLLVTSTGGPPVGGVEVWWGPLGLGGKQDWSLVVPAGRTGEDGQLELQGLPREREVVVAARRRGDRGWTAARYGSDAVGGALALELPPPVTLFVRLESSGRAPVAGARVSLRPGGDAVQAAATGMLRCETAFSPDARASHRFDGLGPGAVWIQATVPGYGVFDREVEIPRGVETHEVVLELSGPSTRTLEVVEAATGDPVPGALVEVFLDGRRENSASSDRRGEVRVPVEALQGRDGELRVDHPRYAPSRSRLTGESSELRVELSEGGEILVRVFDGDGRGVPGVELALRAAGASRRAGGFELPETRWTDERGEALFDRVTAGEWAVARRPVSEDADIPLPWLDETLGLGTGEGAHPVTVQNGQRSVVVIGDASTALSGSIHGQVAVSGADLSQVWIQVHSSNLTESSKQQTRVVDATETGSAFAFDDLPSGSYTVSFSSPLRTSMGGEFFLDWIHIEVAPGEGSRVDRAFRFRTVEVTVTDTAGGAVEGATVIALSEGPEGGAGGNPPVNQLRTDRDGRAAIPLPSGFSSSLFAEHPHYTRSEPVSVPEGEPRVTLVLADGLPFEVRIQAPASVGDSESILGWVNLVSLSETAASRGAVALTANIRFSDGSAELRMRVPAPGQYIALVQIGADSYRLPGTFEVGPAGLVDGEGELVPRSALGVAPSRSE